MFLDFAGSQFPKRIVLLQILEASDLVLHRLLNHFPLLRGKGRDGLSFRHLFRKCHLQITQPTFQSLKRADNLRKGGSLFQGRDQVEAVVEDSRCIVKVMASEPAGKLKLEAGIRVGG